MEVDTGQRGDLDDIFDDAEPSAPLPPLPNDNDAPDAVPRQIIGKDAWVSCETLPLEVVQAVADKKLVISHVRDH